MVVYTLYGAVRAELIPGDYHRRNVAVKEIHPVRQSEAVFSVPARIVIQKHYASAALCLELFALIIGGDRVSLIVCKDHKIRPLFYHRADVRLRCVQQLQLPPVVRAHLVRLLELAQRGVCRQHDIYTFVGCILQLVQQLGKSLIGICIALAVAEVLDPRFVVRGADIRDTHLFCPVDGIYDKRVAYRRVVYDLLYLVHQHYPRCGDGETREVEKLRRAFGVDKYRLRKARRKGRFAYPLGTVYYRF